MKIHSQDGNGVFEFGNVLIPQKGAGKEIWGRGPGEQNLNFLGVYEDRARARGVLTDLEAAYCKGIKIFYMPVK